MNSEPTEMQATVKSVEERLREHSVLANTSSCGQRNIQMVITVHDARILVNEVIAGKDARIKELESFLTTPMTELEETHQFALQRMKELGITNDMSEFQIKEVDNNGH